MRTNIYLIENIVLPNKTYGLHRDGLFETNYWNEVLIKPEDFELASHTLDVIDDDYKKGTSDRAVDFYELIAPVWAISEKGWSWLPELVAGQCRVAENVSVSKGKKQYRLIHPRPVLDLLDHGSSELIWNNDVISWVRNTHFYEYDGEIPLMFQVIYKNRSEYNGSMFRLSGRTFVSQAFKDRYEELGLSGVEFYLIPRTPAPSDRDDSKVWIYP